MHHLLDQYADDARSARKEIYFRAGGEARLRFDRFGEDLGSDGVRETGPNGGLRAVPKPDAGGNENFVRRERKSVKVERKYQYYVCLRKNMKMYTLIIKYKNAFRTS